MFCKPSTAFSKITARTGFSRTWRGPEQPQGALASPRTTMPGLNPYHISRPEKTGFLSLPGHKIYYELRGLQHQQKLIILSPLALTCKFHAQYADRVAEHHCAVLTLDHRGVGKSTGPQQRQMSRQGPACFSVLTCIQAHFWG